MRYTEKQIGWIVITLILGMLALSLISYIYHWGNNPISSSGLLIISIIFIIVLLLFFQMKTSVDSNTIQISYGIGLIKKTIRINEIESVIIVRNKWYYGIGIRMLKNGWLYNIQGLNAIELKMKNSKSIVRIGTANSKILKKKLNIK